MKYVRFTNTGALYDEICDNGLEPYIFVIFGDRELKLDSNFETRMLQVARDTDVSLLYSHYRERDEQGNVSPHPVIDCQLGSVRDDFDFGSIVLLNCADVINVINTEGDYIKTYLDGGWYALRLRLTYWNTVAYIPEYLYTVDKLDNRKSGQKQHDYLLAEKAARQKENEEVLKRFLASCDALCKTHAEVNVADGDFPVEASVVIPVKDRVKTIGDAVASALSQQTGFDFNVIVVDNGSTDGTSEVLDGITDQRLVVIRPNADECLGIGGCWNKAVLDPRCGRFAVQLDSDDVYSGKDTLSRIVEKLHREKCGMVVGSYMLSDFNLNPIPPGVIDHKEWSDRNGANNALRVNGFGAPRAFYTPLVREFLFPNVSYGEDYAMCLRVSRDYKVGRIYDVLYYCRRWEGNSDADLPIEKVNAHNEYKDFIRSQEILARIHDNEQRSEEQQDL